MAIRSAKQSQSVIGLLRTLNVETGSLPRTRPFYRRIVELVEKAINRGGLAAGHRLPPERDLAKALGVSRATVVAAYRELEARGLVRGYVGRGTFVSATSDDGAPFAWRGKISATAIQTTDSTLRDILRHAADPAIVSIAAGEPALDLFPEAAFRRAVDEVLGSYGVAAWGHAPTEGQSRFRETLAHRFGGKPANTMIISGAQQGLDLLARCLIDRGDAVVVDRPGYLGALQSFRSAGARIFGWDFVRADMDELEDLLLRYRPKLIYTNPTFQNPTGVTLPVRARREMIELAQRYRVPIVEDETYCELSFSGAPPPPALNALDADGTVVIRVNSFSKVLAPGLRVGWVGAARPIIEQLALMKQQIDPQTQNLIQMVVCRLIETGTFDRHLATLKAEHRKRRDTMVRTLTRHAPGALRLTPPEGGLFLWCRLTGEASARDVQERALKQSVFALTGEPFYADGGGTRELRLCFSARTPAVGAAAARVVAEAAAATLREGRPELMSRIV